MSLVTDLDLPALDVMDASLRGPRFHSELIALRERTWLATAPFGFVVLDRDACAFFLRTRKATMPGMKIAELFDVQPGPLLTQMERNILHLDGPVHSRLRGLVNPAFTPRAADRWRESMRGFLLELFDDVRDAGRCEFVEAFAKPYPSLMIATVMGAPLSDAPRLHEWSNWIQRQFDGPSLMSDRARIEQACAEFYVWAGELLERRRSAPGDDLISTLIAARFEGDRLTDDELVNLVLNVLVGGVDTTQSQLAHAIRLFAEHPEQWELLARTPELVPQADEEVLRFEPITPFTARITLEDVEYRDITFPEGTVVMVGACAANRAPDVIDAPDAFDITADRGAHKPLTFGAGVHYCLGANLARAELQEGLAFLAPRLPGLRLDGEPVYGSINGIYGLDVLPIAWDGGSSHAGSGAP
jgi:cytochrome P450